MPLYEYACRRCDHRFEIIQRFSDPPVATCPSCGGPVDKLQSAPAFQFKGTGWYATDYAKPSKPESQAASEEGGKANAGKADGGKADGGKTDGKTDGGKAESKAERRTDSKEARTTPSDGAKSSDRAASPSKRAGTKAGD